MILIFLIYVNKKLDFRKEHNLINNIAGSIGNIVIIQNILQLNSTEKYLSII